MLSAVTKPGISFSSLFSAKDFIYVWSRRSAGAAPISAGALSLGYFYRPPRCHQAFSLPPRAALSASAATTWPQSLNTPYRAAGTPLLLLAAVAGPWILPAFRYLDI